MSDKLEACPFCGSDAYANGIDGVIYAVSCSNSNCDLYYILMPIKQWNTRAEQEYKKYEFCKDMDCEELTKKKTSCWVEDNNCHFSAKTFYKWLMQDKYRIIKKE